MLLAIDVGNTNAVFGVYAGSVLRASWRVATVRGYTAADWWAALDRALRARGWSAAAVRACVVGSVVPPVTTALRELCAGFLGFPALVVDGEMNLGVRVATEQPRQ